MTDENVSWDWDRQLAMHNVRLRAAEASAWKEAVLRSGLHPSMVLPTHRKGKLTLITTIDGLRTMVANARPEYIPASVYWCGTDGAWLPVWPAMAPSAPHAARATTKFRGEVVHATAHWGDFAPSKRDGWWRYGPHMLGKCAEALLLRRMAPHATHGIYTTEEDEVFNNAIAFRDPIDEGLLFEEKRQAWKTAFQAGALIVGGPEEFAKLLSKSPGCLGSKELTPENVENQTDLITKIAQRYKKEVQAAKRAIKWAPDTPEVAATQEVEG